MAKDSKRTTLVGVLLTDAEKKRLKKTADRHGLTLSAYCRFVLTQQMNVEEGK